MTFLDRCDPSRYADFLNIASDAFPTTSGAAVDLFVGRHQSVTLTLARGTRLQFRDVVIWGELIIEPLRPDPSPTESKPVLIARDVFAASRLRVTNVDIECRSFNYIANRATFFALLERGFLEWISFRRECVNRSGLKPVLQDFATTPDK